MLPILKTSCSSSGPGATFFSCSCPMEQSNELRTALATTKQSFFVSRWYIIKIQFIKMLANDSKIISSIWLLISNRAMRQQITPRWLIFKEVLLHLNAWQHQGWNQIPRWASYKQRSGCELFNFAKVLKETAKQCKSVSRLLWWISSMNSTPVNVSISCHMPSSLIFISFCGSKSCKFIAN